MTSPYIIEASRRAAKIPTNPAPKKPTAMINIFKLQFVLIGLVVTFAGLSGCANNEPSCWKPDSYFNGCFYERYPEYKGLHHEK